MAKTTFLSHHKSYHWFLSRRMVCVDTFSADLVRWPVMSLVRALADENAFLYNALRREQDHSQALEAENFFLRRHLQNPECYPGSQPPNECDCLNHTVSMRQKRNLICILRIMNVPVVLSL